MLNSASANVFKLCTMQVDMLMGTSFKHSLDLKPLVKIETEDDLARIDEMGAPAIY
jgi:hypothetical protein